MNSCRKCGKSIIPAWIICDGCEYIEDRERRLKKKGVLPSRRMDKKEVLIRDYMSGDYSCRAHRIIGMTHKQRTHHMKRMHCNT